MIKFYYYILMVFLISPINCISISISSEGYSQFNDLILDNSLEYSQNLELSEGTINGNTKFSGSGNNTILQNTQNGIFILESENNNINGEIISSENGITGSVVASDMEIMDEVSTDTMMSVDAITEKGKFSALLAGPEYITNDGSSSAYALKIYKLSKDAVPMQIVVKDDALLRAEGLNAANVAEAIRRDAEIWDSATNKELFADSNTVALSATAKSDTRDNMRVHAFAPSTSSCIAFARTWFSSAKEDGYYKILETDVTYNSKYTFSMDGSNGYDFQSIALHELGHSLGLCDLYASNRAGQVMNGYYHGIDRDLGNGDKTGIFKLYG